MQSRLDMKNATGAGHDRITQDPSSETEELVVFVRLALYNRGLSCGPKALRATLQEHYYIDWLPSERTIARILARNGLTHRRTGWYEGEEWSYPTS